jgi:hypothetical protein
MLNTSVRLVRIWAYILIGYFPNESQIRHSLRWHARCTVIQWLFTSLYFTRSFWLFSLYVPGNSVRGVALFSTSVSDAAMPINNFLAIYWTSRLVAAFIRAATELSVELDKPKLQLCTILHENHFNNIILLRFFTYKGNRRLLIYTILNGTRHSNRSLSGWNIDMCHIVWPCGLLASFGSVLCVTITTIWVRETGSAALSLWKVTTERHNNFAHSGRNFSSRRPCAW